MVFTVPAAGAARDGHFTVRRIRVETKAQDQQEVFIFHYMFLWLLLLFLLLFCAVVLLRRDGLISFFDHIGCK